jgi:hypothetical protein
MRNILLYCKGGGVVGKVAYRIFGKSCIIATYTGEVIRKTKFNIY